MMIQIATDIWGRGGGNGERIDVRMLTQTVKEQGQPWIAEEREERAAPKNVQLLFSLTCIQIPGFYYDPEKKKYFKIQPNQFSSLGHTITKQNIEKKAKEVKRKENLNRQTDKLHTHHFLDLISRQEIGSLSNCQFQRYFIHKRISCIDNNSTQTIVVPSIHGIVEHPKVMGLNSNSDKLISLWDLTSSLAKFINIADVSMANFGAIEIDFENSDLSLCAGASSIFWTEKKKSLPLHLLYTTVPFIGNTSSTAYICKVSNQGMCGTPISYSIGQKYIWCCALDSDYRRFCIGCEKGALLIEVETRRLWEIYSHKSDVFSTTFTHQNPCLLFCGNMKGHILTRDTRSHPGRTFTELKMKGLVTSLQLTQDDVHLLANDALGNALLWDLRMKKVVVEYRGMKNEGTRIPVHMDVSEELVYGCDLEGYTRFWCKNSGRLLRTIPSPVPCSSTCVPVVLYSDRWGNKAGNSALLLGSGNKLYIYKV
ncbi:DDB1- and CUL4-associated factor 4-like [Saccostrea cucullata]|uniref:DDB1- and CUL4-associated factor 4-like n=1 Tax=Saccostrea cuccullata TaxID=36930 RepID=UPI002ED28ECC